MQDVTSKPVVLRKSRSLRINGSISTRALRGSCLRLGIVPYSRSLVECQHAISPRGKPLAIAWIVAKAKCADLLDTHFGLVGIVFAQYPIKRTTM